MTVKNLINPDVNIVFVCSGNIIRSAFAELYALDLLPTAKFSSIGTTFHNSRIHPEAQNELERLGVSPKLVSEFTPTHIRDHKLAPKQQYLYLVMTQSHVQHLLGNGIDLTQIYLLSNLIDKDSEIEDPYFTGGFTTAFRTIRKCIDELVKVLKME